MCTSVHAQVKDSVAHAKDTALPGIDSLKAAIVTARPHPKIMGDTVEYNTEHMLLQRNASAEDMLRRLPGLRVDMDGNITYNGEKIKRLLVDGEDIFGADPTLITHNLDAYKIARVEVLERKSDQANFSGVDDGVRTKTLNLVLKKGEKDGYFGRVGAGGGTNGYYSADGVLAALRDREQVVGLGFAANTGVLGSGGSQGISGILFSSEGTDGLGASAGNGIPQLTAGALHYANTWNGSEGHLAANYQYGHYFTQPVTTSESLQTQPDSVYGQYQQSRSANREDQHSLDVTYDLAPNRASAFRIQFHGTSSAGQNQFMAAGKSTFNDTLVNSNLRTINDRVSQRNIGGDLAWRSRIGNRIERICSVTTGLNRTDNLTDGFLYSVNSFYQSSGALQSIDTVDQRKRIANNSINWHTTVTYTEPLWKDATLGTSYGLAIASDKPVQATYNKGIGKYEEIVDSLSSYLTTELLSQKVTLVFQGKGKRLSYSIGSDWIAYVFRQRDLIVDSVINMHYFNWAPRLLLNYNVNATTNFSFDYQAGTQQPEITQLRTFRNNIDPLHVTLGNPTLRPSLNHAFRFDLHQLKAWIINLSVNLALTQNSISTKTTTDSLGRQISQPVNVNGWRNAGLNFSANRKILGLDVGLHGDFSYSRTVNFVNADASHNTSYHGGAGFGVDKYIPNKWLLQLNTDFSYFDQVSSINNSAPVRYWAQNHIGSLTILFIRNFLVMTNVTYTWQAKTSAFATNTSICLWNAQVSRIFMNNRLVLQARLNNILNKSNGISRSNINNSNSETITNTLGRYWMLSMFYQFDKKARRK